MNVGQIVKRVRDAVGDTTALQFKDDTLVSWINDGVRECAQQNLLLQKRATTSTIIGTKEYDLPTDILKLHSVNVNSSKIRMITLQEFHATHDESTETGLPTLGYVWVGKLNLYPVPDRVASIDIDYIRDPVDIVWDEPGAYKELELDIPSMYHTRIVDYCIAQVAQQDGDSNLYSVKMQEFTTGVQQLRDKPEWDDDLYPFMSVSPRDMGEEGSYYG